MSFIRRYGLYFAWVLATIASSVIVYLTEGQQWDPCRICWYQQICMLPLVPIIGMAAWYGFQGIVKYLLPQTLTGLGLAIYQVVQEYIDPIAVKNPPIEIWKPGYVEMLSFNMRINLPILSLIAFFLINLLLFIVRFVAKRGDLDENKQN